MSAVMLISNYITWLLAIVPVGAGAMVTYQAVRKAFTNDLGVVQDCNLKIKNTIIGAIICICLVGLISIVRTFYN